MTDQAAAAKPIDQAEPFEPALVIFGEDDARKAHASVFAAADVELATKAAGLMRMFALPVEGDECRSLALSLARGRIFASGAAFAPFCKRPAYEALKALGGEVPPVPEPATNDAADTAPATLPTTGPATSWATLEPGQLVLAPEEPTDLGFFEAVVLEVKAEDLVELRWRDWPDLDAFVRHPHDLALLHAQAEE